MRLHPSFLATALMALLSISQPSRAQETATFDSAVCQLPAGRVVAGGSTDRAQSPVVIDALGFSFSEDTLILEGQVDLTRADQHLETDTLRYNQASGDIDMPEPMRYSDSAVELRAARAAYNLASSKGEFRGVTYSLIRGQGNGSASLMRIDAKQHAELRDVSFSTCSIDKPDWLIAASEIELDTATGRGVAENAVLRFKGVPLLYAPKFSFPIDDRRVSGFLYPELGTSNDNGFDITVPWYWNISPNQDATLSGRLVTDRGLMLGTEYRWLGTRQSGVADLRFLSSDEKTRDDRYRYRLNHQTRFSPRWQSRIGIDRVSDDAYFEDFGQGLAETSRQFTRSSAVVSGQGRYWEFEVLADDFQVLDSAVAPEREPYRRLPRLAYRQVRPLKDSLFDLNLDTEFVSFDRDIGATGSRLDIYPTISWDYQKAAGFVKPSLGYRLTRYQLDSDSALLNGFTDSSPGRSLPIFSVDAGLVFEKSLANGTLQTLEPRLFYLNVPFEDQSDLPDFDTAELTFGFSQLFHSNRFAGADRQADANQLTLALSSRNLSPATGAERFNVNIGQIFFFQNRKVQLDPAAPADTNNESSFISELNFSVSENLATRAGLQWSWDQSEVEVGYAGFHWKGKGDRQLSADYRFRRDRVNQVDLRLSTPLRKNWRGIMRFNYDLDGSSPLETLAGVEYRSCCWAFRAVARRYLRNRDGEDRTGLFLELELTGLGSIGRRPYPLFAKDRFGGE